MDDKRIIQLFFARDERAISEVGAKYGRLLFGISYGILSSAEDSEECVDDAYLRAWNAIPPTVPRSLSAFLCRIVRNVSIDRYKHNKRRASLRILEITDELCECIPSSTSDPSSELALRDALNGFLETLTESGRRMFVKRYFFALSIEQIADELGESCSNVKTTLFRLRGKLKEYLKAEQIYL